MSEVEQIKFCLHLEMPSSFYRQGKPTAESILADKFTISQIKDRVIVQFAELLVLDPDLTINKGSDGVPMLFVKTAKISQQQLAAIPEVSNASLSSPVVLDSEHSFPLPK